MEELKQKLIREWEQKLFDTEEAEKEAAKLNETI